MFGRSPTYDPGTDPVVRITAAEVRKRLAQYYQEPGHAGEIRIELPVGSYVPEFHLPPGPGIGVTEPAPPMSSLRRLRVWLAVAAAVLVLWAAAGWRPHGPPSALDRFWHPVVAGGGEVMVCVGAAPAGSQATPEPGLGGVAWPDVQALVRIGGLLQEKGLSVQLCREAQASFSDFQRMPAVLIGAFNDEWTLRLMENMRFQFRREGSSRWIEDRDRPESRAWSINLGDGDAGGYLSIVQDYGVISRVMNPRTGRISVIVAGLSGYGTVAATQLLTEPAHAEILARAAPAGWQDRNLQIVLGTEVIESASGPPRVLSLAVW